MGRITELKMLGVLLDAAMIILVVFMVIYFFSLANEIAEEREEATGPIPEHVL